MNTNIQPVSRPGADTLVSVIIPAYNAEKWIATSIESVLAQTYKQIEMVVIDDGSRDNTAAIVQKINNPRIKLIRQENRGNAAAMNRGAKESRGFYLKILDSDDWLNPPHIAAQIQTLANQDECVASCRWGNFFDLPESPKIRSESTSKDYEDPLEWLVDSLTKDEAMMGGWMWLIPRTVWDRAGGWNERLTLNNDFDFSIRLLLASKGVRFVHDAIYSYRKGIQGAVSGLTGRAAMESAFLTTELGCRALLNRENSSRIRRICADRWQQWLYLFYPQYGDLAEAAEKQIATLGGSTIPLQGGRLLQGLLPVLGWKGVRRLQVASRKLGWNSVLDWKARARNKQLAIANR
ncbi:MAG TPA: glycosyltransferase family 2 protein [Verrucomicrobiae bacterium]